MVVDGEIEVVCEFCSADYHFSRTSSKTEN